MTRIQEVDEAFDDLRFSLGYHRGKANEQMEEIQSKYEEISQM